MDFIKINDKSFDLYISQSQIENKIENIAQNMNKDLANKKPIFISVLNGAFMFSADLLKKINFDCEISFIKLASYKGTKSDGIVKQIIGLNTNIEKRTVVILEDIIDTGNTIGSIINQLLSYKPIEIKVATLLFKKEACLKKLTIDYVGFEVPNDFVVGYGMDYNGFGRNLVNIYKLI
jgi:hypoxanthine phosphoribosyltransferase